MSGRPSGLGPRSLNAAPSVRRGATLNRGKTLSRPERFQTPDTMFKKRKENEPASCWVICSRITTCWALPPVMKMCGIHDKQVQQAWREKVTLCFIIMMVGGMVAFMIIGFSTLLCPPSQQNANNTFKRFNDPASASFYGINGTAWNFLGAKWPPGINNTLVPGQDVSNNWKHGGNPQFCGQVMQTDPLIASFDNCANGCLNPVPVTATLLRSYGASNDDNFKVGFDWNQMALPMLKNYFVIDGNVINMDAYMTRNPKATGGTVDTVIRYVLSMPQPEGGRDATKLFFRTDALKNSASCLVEKFGAGFIDKATPGCFASDLFMYVSLTVVLGLVMSRFAMAVIFNWFLSAKLAKPPSKQKVQTMASAASSGTTIVGGTVPASAAAGVGAAGAKGGALARSGTSASIAGVKELHTVLLVTCYSEGESSLRTTIESLAATEYPDNKKMLFIICDGIITGSGNDRSTPDICSSLLELDPAFDTDPTPQSYLAVAAGSKQHNRAKVYAGYFRWKNRRVPTILVVKCGNEEEQDKPKAGNRGKRDSQLILMNFFSRVTYNDRMTPLDYELFRKVQHLMQVTPDTFEIVLMVDADTKVYPSSLRLLLNCVNNDPLIMGLCGETKIANKRQSWVTAIQVFEYYISHHLGKGFESVFGGVTCLPGCFCMYRLKAKKGDNDWVPIITKPEIVQEYSQNVVETLHQKNLLLLGEDRFLTTLMLRNFPNRKMMFMPQAICKTVVPDEFNVLLSQRRRWINSTIHNLLELVLVRNLCGTFCFSMQFVIFMELIGTVVLPVAMILTVVLIVNLATTTFYNISQMIPLILLVLVLGMPAILILLTTRKLIYIAWMFVYLAALPVWNFILPLYAYWHFDDFSWGETRKVAGEAKGEAHGNADGQFDANRVPLKRWDEYEKARVRQVKRIERAERQRATPSPYSRSGAPSVYTDADTESDMMSDLGPQQQHYDYNGRQVLSPPLQGAYGRPPMMGGPPSPGHGGPMMMGGPGPQPGGPRGPPSPGWNGGPPPHMMGGPPPMMMGGGGPGPGGPPPLQRGPSFNNNNQIPGAPPPSSPGGMRRNRSDNNMPSPTMGPGGP